MATRSLNRATLVGNVGRDPEIRQTPQGAHVCTIRLATTESFRNKRGEWLEITDWHSIVLWDRLAEIAHQLLRKGDRILIEGKIRTRIIDQGGYKKHFTEIIAQNMIILERKNKEFNSHIEEVLNEVLTDDFLNPEVFLASSDVFDMSED